MAEQLPLKETVPGSSPGGRIFYFYSLTAWVLNDTRKREH